MIEVRDANNNIVQVDNPTLAKQQQIINEIALLSLKIDVLQNELQQKFEAGEVVNVGNFPAQISGYSLETTQALTKLVLDNILAELNNKLEAGQSVNVNTISGFGLETTLQSILTELNQKLEAGQSVNVGNFPSQISGFNLEATQLQLKTVLDNLLVELSQKLEAGQSIQVSNLPTTQAISGSVTVLNPTANPESGLSKEVTLQSILDKIVASPATETKQDTLISSLLSIIRDEDTPHTSGNKGVFILAIRNDSDIPTADNGDYTPLKLDEEGRLKVAVKPASYPDVMGDITAIQATIGTPVAGGTVIADVSRCSNVVMFCVGTFNTVNCAFEASLELTGENWFSIQAVRTNANTIETTTGNLSATPAYAWEMSVNAYARVRVRCTARTSGTQSWRFKLGTYATEPIPAAQISGTQPVSGTVTVTATVANIGTVAPSIFTDSNVNLGVSGVLTGTSRDVGGTASFQQFVVSAFADQAGSFRVEKSTDNTIWRRATAEIPVVANEGKEYSVKVTARYYRIIYTNGAVAQTQSLLTSAYHKI